LRVAVLQFDTRPPEQLGELLVLVARNREYAARHGYDHHFIDHAPHDLPVYWQKPSLCRDMMLSGYDLVLWLDTDAVIHDQARAAESLFTGAEIMVASGDNPLWASPFNAGVFAVRGGSGAALMERWAALFAGAAWTRSETAWTCQGEWAGPDFEQGAFVRELADELVRNGQLRLLDWRALQAPFPLPGAFALHFAGVLKANLPAYLSLLMDGEI
jgi:hypothetical protein